MNKLLVTLLAIVTSLEVHAQKPAPTVDEVVSRVRANVTAYRASIPNFSCDESVVSQHLDGTKVKEEMKIESSFRITRDATGVMRETRIKKLVNGKAVKDQKVSPPYTFQGGFANIPGFLNSPCNDFSFGPSGPYRSDGKIVLLGTSKPSTTAALNCRVPRAETEVLIDPETFQVLRFASTIHDFHMSGGVITRLFMTMPSDHNIMKTVITYTLTTLGEKTFWLPKVVENTLGDTIKPINLRFEATYSNYHRYTATSTIISTSESALQ